MAKGTIGVTTDNIFPVIKKFLYSDHEIFLRELVSNAVDATQKLKTCAMKGDFKGDLGDLAVRVSVDEKAGTLTVSDRGLGMTAEEIDKYINQIAFSGVTDFLDKYKDDANAIIGHFGLGFYSAFMVAKKVEILTRSYREDAKAVRWTCDGSPEYDMEDAERADRGTDIILHIDDDCKEFLEKGRIQSLLEKYCKFLPVPVVFGKKTEWKDGKQVDTEEDNQINDVNPIWTRKPSELKDEDYKKFYRELYPMADEPLFWIHLNVDYPFNLTGVLYFPKIKSNLDFQRNRIQLYCNQVFVTDQVENIVPDFLTLLHGVIDSPDIPLNVSRSYLQSDQNVKKISTYITKKVSDRLQSIFKNDRKTYEEKWDDLKLFIHYGMLTQPDFYDKAKDFALLKDVDGKYYTYEEYKELIKGEQTDKNDTLVYLYANQKEAQYSFIESAKAKGYNVLLMDGQLDTALVGMLEQKFEKTRFSRVDGDTIDKLIVKTDAKSVSLNEEQTGLLTGAFQSQMPKIEKTEFHVEVGSLGEGDLPVVVTQSEYMRRMKEMSQLQSGMSFYGEMPDMYNLVLNADHPLVKKVLDETEADTRETLAPIEAEIKGLKARQQVLEQQQKDKKADEITDEDKKNLTDCHEQLESEQKKREETIAASAAKNDVLHQLIDLALLRNGLLKGEALDKFLKRSVNLMK
ncbi:aTPase/histidine kinase/DNA gyrase B/HSP90 domain protein [Prevotella sp. CAG:617]|jgi:heat shock protein htpG|nr:aTPase/histidine kinase/DNA gyrase B/HSP90 domain protein [Prevotella sp. CAG:617]